MTAVRLTKDAKRLLRSASRERIGDYFTSLPPHERRTKWLRAGNRYRTQCVLRYRSDLDAVPSTIDDQQLVDYLAASGPAHVIDGWSFLGRALDSALRRDTYSAIHFAYYAELRAAMGLLACEGVGIFQDRHPVVDGMGQTKPLPKLQARKRTGGYESRWATTHTVIGPCLKHWSTLKRSADLLDELITPSGFQLTEWLSSCGVSMPGRAIAQQWLQAWGLDISQLAEDHSARNMVSYRPCEFRSPANLAAEEILAFFQELWSLFEPSEPRRFPSLERVLLRRALRLGGIPAPAVVDIRKLGISEAEATEWATFLAQANDPRPLLAANISSEIEDPHCHLQVISRAALLLYVATGSAGGQIGEQSYTRTDLEFWWKRFGLSRCLWTEGAVADTPADVWADIVVALQDIDNWKALVHPQDPSLRGWRTRYGSSNADLSAFDVLAIWGLTP